MVYNNAETRKGEHDGNGERATIKSKFDDAY